MQNGGKILNFYFFSFLSLNKFIPFPKKCRFYPNFGIRETTFIFCFKVQPFSKNNIKTGLPTKDGIYKDRDTYKGWDL